MTLKENFILKNNLSYKKHFRIKRIQEYTMNEMPTRIVSFYLEKDTVQCTGYKIFPVNRKKVSEQE